MHVNNEYIQGALLVGIIMLVGLSAFGLGRLSVYDEREEDIEIEYTIQQGSGESQGASEVFQGDIVASRNGTKYHYTWCPSAKNIAQANVISFTSIQAARNAGYEPAQNCEGLK